MKARLVLASGSARRQEMLRFLKIPHEVEISGASEEWPQQESAVRTARSLALRKVQSIVRPEALVVAMDTIVVIGREKLGKPRDAADALRMLRLLSGHTHRVVTGVALKYGRKEIADAETTRVHFRPLKDREIRQYVRSGEPFDKAGAYAIQGLARLFIDRIEGCYYNVVGFPVSCFLRCLDRLGMTIYDLME